MPFAISAMRVISVDTRTIYLFGGLQKDEQMPPPNERFQGVLRFDTTSFEFSRVPFELLPSFTMYAVCPLRDQTLLILGCLESEEKTAELVDC